MITIRLAICCQLVLENSDKSCHRVVNQDIQDAVSELVLDLRFVLGVIRPSGLLWVKLPDKNLVYPISSLLWPPETDKKALKAVAAASSQCDQQCDQMAGLLVQYSDIYNNENLPSIKNCSNGVKFWKIPSKNFAKSGHTGDHQNLTIYTKSNLPNSTKITQVPKFAKYNIKPS